jgi:hypothetical protein
MYTRRAHEGWWCASAELLGVDPNLDEEGIGVTPAVLSREITLSLLRHLEGVSGGHWYRAVVDYIGGLKSRGLWRPVPGTVFRTPTEYTLYYLFAELTGRATEHHVKSERLWRRRPIFGREDLADALRDNVEADETDGLFLVLQSNLGLAPSRTWDVVRRIARLDQHASSYSKAAHAGARERVF